MSRLVDQRWSLDQCITEAFATSTMVEAVHNRLLAELRTLRAAQELLDEIRRLNRECNLSYFSLKTRELLDAYDTQIARLDAMKEGKANG